MKKLKEDIISSDLYIVFLKDSEKMASVLLEEFLYSQSEKHRSLEDGTEFLVTASTIADALKHYNQAEELLDVYETEDAATKGDKIEDLMAFLEAKRKTHRKPGEFLLMESRAKRAYAHILREGTPASDRLAADTIVRRKNGMIANKPMNGEAMFEAVREKLMASFKDIGVFFPIKLVNVKYVDGAGSLGSVDVKLKLVGWNKHESDAGKPQFLIDFFRHHFPDAKYDAHLLNGKNENYTSRDWDNNYSLDELEQTLIRNSAARKYGYDTDPLNKEKYIDEYDSTFESGSGLIVDMVVRLTKKNYEKLLRFSEDFEKAFLSRKEWERMDANKYYTSKGMIANKNKSAYTFVDQNGNKTVVKLDDDDDFNANFRQITIEIINAAYDALDIYDNEELAVQVYKLWFDEEPDDTFEGTWEESDILREIRAAWCDEFSVAAGRDFDGTPVELAKIITNKMNEILKEIAPEAHLSFIIDELEQSDARKKFVKNRPLNNTLVENYARKFVGKKLKEDTLNSDVIFVTNLTNSEEDVATLKEAAAEVGANLNFLESEDVGDIEFHGTVKQFKEFADIADVDVGEVFITTEDGELIDDNLSFIYDAI